jgi:hypothetical protein
MEWFEPDIQALETALLTRRLPGTPVVFYGSSSIRLWSTLAQDLGSECAVNLGFGGSTLEACVWYFERLVPPVRPASLVVYAGDNDLGDGRRPAEVVEWFRALVVKASQHLNDASLGFISIKPSPARVDLLAEIVETNRAIAQEIAAIGTTYFIDVFTPMLAPGARPRPELFLEDGLHLNRAGYELWARVLSRHRDRMFTRECAGCNGRQIPSREDGTGIP